jgi:hypothetical protein
MRRGEREGGGGGEEREREIQERGEGVGGRKRVKTNCQSSQWEDSKGSEE